MSDPHDQAYAYVVGALPPAEVSAFEEHLGGCDTCAAEVSALQSITADLSTAVATSPPPGLRSAVLAAIANVPQSPAATSIPAARRRPAAAIAAEERPSRVVPLRRSYSPRLPALLAAAAVIAALGFGGWAWQDRQATQQQLRQATQRTSQLTELLSAPDVKTVTGRGVVSGITGTVVLSPSRRKAVLVASSLPQLPAGKVYEAWTIVQEPVPAATFAPDDAKTLVPLPPRALAAQSVAITIEPAGGSPHPTTDAIFTVNIPST